MPATRRFSGAYTQVGAMGKFSSVAGPSTSFGSHGWQEWREEGETLPQHCSASILMMDLLGLGLGRIRLAHVTQFYLDIVPAAANSNSSLSSPIVRTYLCVRFSERCLHYRPHVVFLLVCRFMFDFLMLLEFPIVYIMMGSKSG